MLLRNGTSLGANPGWSGGANVYHMGLENTFKSGSRKGFHASPETVVEPAINNGIPSGCEHPTAWLMPMKGGGLAAFNTIEGSGIVTANLAMGKALSASLTGSGEISASAMSLIVQLLANLSGSGALTAEMKGVVQLASNLAGSGDLTVAMGLIVSLAAGLTGSSSVSSSNLTGIAHLAAEITSTGELVTAESCAEAVFNKLIENGLTFEEITKILLAFAAGKTAKTDLGGGDFNLKFKSQDETKDRIDADLNADSERTNVTLDGS